MKRKWVFQSSVFILLLVGIWVFVFRNAGMYSVREGIPHDAVFVVETPSFDRIREKLYQNKIWTSLKEYPYFEAYHAHLNQVDSLCTVYPVMRKLLTDRPFAVSCHFLPGDRYDFLYVCDLGKLNVIQALDGLAGALFGRGKLVKRGEVTEIRLGDVSFYYTIKANLLWASFTPLLVERGKAMEREEKSKKDFAGDINLNLDHRLFEKLLTTVLREVPDGSDPSAFQMTTLGLNLSDKALYLKGETTPNRSRYPLLSALNLMDGGSSEVSEIIADHVAAYVSFCFSSFAELESILLEDYQVNHLKQSAEYEQMVRRINKYLGVNIVELLTSWIGNEIAVIKPAVDKENRLDNLVLAVKSKDIDLAKDQLGYLTEQISRKTPVRFRDMDYNGHHISYLSLKGFFNLFLGKFFKKFDRPYYTFLGEYVVFSNSASTLATMIKDYSLGKTLAREEKYNTLMEQLGNKNNIYGYISTPEAYEYLSCSLPESTKAELAKNKGAFQSFESIGFTLSNAGSVFATRIIANHNINAAEDYKVKELNRGLEELADQVESGYYQVVIPDSIAVSTRGDYAYSQGELHWEGQLSNGDPEGIWKITDKKGKVVAHYVYRDALPQGETCFFYPDGVIAARVLYQKGKIQLYKEFFPDGTLKMELEYSKGVRHGDVRFYYSTGHLLGEGRYKKGQRAGTWKYYRVTGELNQKLKF